MSDDDLGKRLFTTGLTLRGRLTVSAWRVFLDELTRAMGMAVAGDPATWYYPLEDGKGGTGMTMIQPITESFLALDTWPDHGGAYLMICSCKSFNLADVDRVCGSHGLIPNARFNECLELVP